MPTRRYAVTASTFSTDPRRAVDSARSAGFAGVAFDAVTAGFDLTTLSDTGRREFRHVLASRQLELVAVQAEVGPKGLGPTADLDQILARLDKVLRSASGVPGAMLCVDAGTLPEPARAVPTKPKISREQAGLILIPDLSEPAPTETTPPPDPKVLSATDTALAALGSLADRYSVVIAWRSELSSFAAVDRALAAAACPWFGVDLDPVAMLRDTWTADAVFDRLGGRVRHVRGRDAVAGTERRTRPAAVGRGDTKWDRLLANLNGADYAGWVTFDPVEMPDRAAAAAAGLKYLKLHE